MPTIVLQVQVVFDEDQELPDPSTVEDEVHDLLTAGGGFLSDGSIGAASVTVSFEDVI